MKLYVCWGTFPVPLAAGRRFLAARGASCKRADDALLEAGTGESHLPVLVLDDGQVISDSKETAAWAKANPERQVG